MRIEQTHSSYRDKKKRRLSLLLLFQMKKKEQRQWERKFLKKTKKLFGYFIFIF